MFSTLGFLGNSALNRSEIKNVDKNLIELKLVRVPF